MWRRSLCERQEEVKDKKRGSGREKAEKDGRDKGCVADTLAAGQDVGAIRQRHLLIMPGAQPCAT